MHFFMRRGLAEVCPELAPVSASCLRALTLLSGGVPSGGIARKRSKPFLPTSRLIAPLLRRVAGGRQAHPQIRFFRSRCRPPFGTGPPRLAMLLRARLA